MDWSDEFLMTFPYLEGHYLINIIKMYANSTTKGNPSQNNLTPPPPAKKRKKVVGYPSKKFKLVHQNLLITY